MEENKTIYVTCNIRMVAVGSLPSEIRRYAVACGDSEEARKVACDMYSIDGVRFIRFRMFKPRKDAKVMTAEQYFKQGGL